MSGSGLSLDIGFQQVEFNVKSFWHQSLIFQELLVMECYFHITELMSNELNGVNVDEGGVLFGCRKTLETSASH